MLGYDELKSAFAELRLADKPVIVHASLKKFGPIEGGGEAVLQAILATTNGLVVPTFTYRTMVTPEVGPPNNGITYGKDKGLNRMSIPFHLKLPPDKEMGLLSRTLLERNDAIRTAHPILSFGGIGVDNILIAQTLYEPLAPIGVLAEQDGWVVLINVGHDVNTSIHYGEKLAGRRQFIRWAMVADRIVECPGYPGDSSGFHAIEEWVQRYTRQVQVNHAVIKAVPLRQLLEAVREMIKKDPLALLCERESCEMCNDLRGIRAIG